MSRSRSIASSVAASMLVAAALAVGTPSPAGASWPSSNGVLAFRTMRDGNAQIYTLTTDGSATQNISRSSATELDPAFSPDGDRIAYARSLHPGGRQDLYVMNADGQGGFRLTATTLAERQPAWSPDGTRIAFVARVAAGAGFRLFVMNADGSGPTQIATGSSDTDDFAPAWSPDGSSIAFASTRAGGFPEIYTVAPDGTGLRRVTDNQQIDGSPTWSPDGTRLAIERCCLDGSSEIYVVALDRIGRNEPHRERRRRVTPGMVARRLADRLRERGRRDREP